MTKLKNNTIKTEQFLERYEIERQNLKKIVGDKIMDLNKPDDVLKKLSKIDWGFLENDTSYLTHDIHPYPAKYIPQLPATIISELSKVGEQVWDPFGGSGTTALEALLLKRRSLSTDANPLASVIGRCKTLTLDKDDYSSIQVYRQYLVDSLRAGNIKREDDLVPNIPNISKWFNGNVIDELSFIKKSIVSLSENLQVITKTALSRTVAKMSNQDGETRYASVSREIKDGETLNCYIVDFDTVVAKVNAVGTILKGVKPKFETYDLRESILNEKSPIEPNEIDLIVTSPPYANATDYHLYHRFRMFWLDFNPVLFGKKEIGSHLRHQKEKTNFEDYMLEMRLCLENCYTALRPGRYAVYIIGNSVFNKTVYDTAEAYTKVSREIGFEFVGKIKRSLHKNRRYFESSARRAQEETILILKKPLNKKLVNLFEANYKLWDYERDLLKLESTQLFKKQLTYLGEKRWELDGDNLDISKLKKLTFIKSFEYNDQCSEKTWQSMLESGLEDGNSVRRESKYVTHGVHEYKGKFYPQLCKSLYNIAGLQEGASVLDPFGGSGTTALEGYLNGYRTFSCDMNPLAVLIQKAKIEVLQVRSEFLFDMIKLTISNVEGYNNEPSLYLYKHLPQTAHKEVESWFPNKVIYKLGFIMEKIAELPDGRVQNFIRIILSNIVREISQQEPSDLRIRRRSTPIYDAPVVELFLGELRKQLTKLQHFFAVADKSPSEFLNPTIWEGDSRDIQSFYSVGLKNASMDAVITSPPYATALPYIDTNRLSLLLLLGMNSTSRNPIEESLVGSREIKKSTKDTVELEIENGNFGHIKSQYATNLIKRIYDLNNANEVGFRRKNMASLLYNYFEGMSQTLNNIDRLLKDNGSVFLVMGNNVTTSGETKIDIETTKMLMETGLEMGWKFIDEICITVTSDNLKNIGNAIKKNSILWFKKK